MSSKLRFGLLLPLAFLLACGSDSTGSGNYLPVSGDYVMTVSTPSGASTRLVGALNIQGLNVTGQFLYSSPQSTTCGPTSEVAVSGSINSAGTLMTLTSTSFAAVATGGTTVATGSTATFTLNLPLVTNSSGTTAASGTAVITGGTCAIASSTMQTQFIPSFAGTWSGPVSGTVSGTISLGVQQSTTANVDGQFTAAGTVSFTGSGCSLTTTALTGTVSGYNLFLASGDSSIAVTVNASTSPATISLSGSCAGGDSGTITH